MSLADILPPSLLLPPHLSAHKYFMVCTLTVAAWDTLVLSPRAFRLFRSEGWPALKLLFHFVRYLMPIEFTIVAVAFFDTKWTKEQCQSFYLFEPIATAVLLAGNSAIHVLRIHGIYEKSRPILFGLGALLALQIVGTGVASAFYRPMPLDVGQGCIAGPKSNVVGIYWVGPTLLYTVSVSKSSPIVSLATTNCMGSLGWPSPALSGPWRLDHLSYWKLMLRDGLNFYGAIWIVNMVNMLFWFIVTPTDTADTIKTIVTSMAAVLTTSMSMRIVLSVRGGLAQGGSFALSGATSSTGHTSSRSGTTHVISTNSRIGTGTGRVPTYDLNGMGVKSQHIDDNLDDKPQVLDPRAYSHPQANPGVKIDINREVVYDETYGAGRK
ncbi:hypothetical protein DL96DRAFT_1613075 [Flagelloscypha sp. PMI_526]|nr:hypothetical protein DL96DRAFT_1613075 [Flagelloscypha sp. PMI_526]